MAKKLIYRNIFGRKVNIKDDDTVSIRPVASLPSTGAEGQFYYNTTDKKYYTWNSTKSTFEQIGNADMPRVTETITPGVKGYDLEPDILYDDCFIWKTEDDEQSARTVSYLTINITASPDIAKCYTFRTTVPQGDFNIQFNTNIKVPDEVNDFISNMESGHKYEFNIFADYLTISDITVTVQDDDAEDDEEQGGE